MATHTVLCMELNKAHVNVNKNTNTQFNIEDFFIHGPYLWAFMTFSQKKQ